VKIKTYVRIPLMLPILALILAVAIVPASAVPSFSGDPILNLAYNRLNPQFESADAITQAITEIGGLMQVRSSASGPEVRGMIRYNGSIPALEDKGVALGTSAGGWTTAWIPVANLADVANLPGMQELRSSAMMSVALDSSVPATNAPTARDAFAIDGNGVIVGVIDTGIDFSHPDFLNPDGSSRILLYWDMTEISGVPPTGFGAGAEYTNAELSSNLDRMFASAGAALAIPDNNVVGVTSTITISAASGVVINDLFVDVEINHPNTDDLVVVLTNVSSGTSVVLHGAYAGPSGPAPANVDYIFASYDQAIPGVGPGHLDDFNGAGSAGDWALNVVDGVAGNAGGQILNWRLRINQTVYGGDYTGHGTMVAGVASGGADGSPYAGMATSTQLIVVKATVDATSTMFSEADVMDALSYIDQRATLAGLPYVVNMSLGGHMGAHDGSSPLEQLIDATFGSAPGKAIVVSAGNEGAQPIHAESALVPPSSPSYLGTRFKIITGADDIFLDIWYDGANDYNFQLIEPSPGFAIIPGVPLGTVGASIGNATHRILVSHVNYPGNGDNEILIRIQPESATPVDPGDWTLQLNYNTLSGPASFDAWTDGEFLDNVSPNKTVGIPGTANSALTVGAYTTKTNWTSLDGNPLTFAGTPALDDLCTFSSMGPTRDGRNKPDITAPGSAIASMRAAEAGPSSAFSNFAAYGDETILTDTGYAVSMGTSLSAPHVAGAAALLLQMDGSLSANDVNAALTTTAATNTFSDMVGYYPNEQWGYGVLNMLAASVFVNGGTETIEAYSDTIVAFTGGTVQAGPSGRYINTRIEIPAGSMAGDALVSIKTPADDYNLTTSAEFGPQGLLFSTPATVYIEFLLEDVPVGSTINDMKIHYWNGTTWVPVVDATQPLVHLGGSRYIVSAQVSNLDYIQFAVTDLTAVEDWRMY
jgi:subtilisin-like proprotein convertase family protein